jgi:endonuclease/exonuclease/phosphatase family metal-dependent hydrolase
MDRSYIAVDLDVGRGRTFTVIGAHLQRHDESNTRAIQIETVLDAWGGARPAVIAGDMNVQPDEADVEIFGRAGLVSAQDVTGHAHLGTAALREHPTEHGDHPDRVDWIFVTPDLEVGDFRIPFTTASDHLPIAVTISLG